MNQEIGHLEVYLSTPKLSALFPLKLPFDETRRTRKPDPREGLIQKESLEGLHVKPVVDIFE